MGRRSRGWRFNVSRVLVLDAPPCLRRGYLADLGVRHFLSGVPCGALGVEVLL